MQFTKAAGYGIQGLIHLASASNGSGKESFVAEIARAREIPSSFLAKIFQNLSRAGIVRSHRGAKGGFSLAVSPDQINVREIIEAIDGPINLYYCMTGKNNCSQSSGCPVLHVWREAQDRMLEVLKSYTLKDLVDMQNRNHRESESETPESRLIADYSVMSAEAAAGG